MLLTLQLGMVHLFLAKKFNMKAPKFPSCITSSRARVKKRVSINDVMNEVNKIIGFKNQTDEQKKDSDEFFMKQFDATIIGQKGWTIPVLDKGYVRLIDHLGTDERICEAARISYKSPSKGADQDKKLIAYLWKNKHTSPFEMVKITLNIKMPIFVMRQYVRHRMQNLNEMSARYTELPSEFYIPTEWRLQDTKNKQGSTTASAVKNAKWQRKQTNRLLKICDLAYKTYQEMLDDGVAREMARMVLPVNIYTEIYCCWDMKNLLHFISLRDDAHAQAEIQAYGKAIKTMCKKLFPWTMEAYEKYKWTLIENENIIL